MQEEVTQKTIALSMKTGKLTAQALQAALKKYLQHRAKGPKLHHGKQAIRRCEIQGRNDTGENWRTDTEMIPKHDNLIGG